jgi:SAM-dependent methyltransferase
MTEDFDFCTSPDTFLALRCGRCGGVYLSLVPADDTLAARIYPPEYFARHGPAWRHTPPQGTRVLDLGPLVGPDQLGRLAREGSAYDLVRLDLTLECAPDPLAVLQAVHPALRPGGRVVLLLNNLRSPAFAWFGGRHWGGYDTPRQRRVLTRDGLARLALAADLDVAEVRFLSAGEPWVRSFHRWFRDWNAPGWLTSRFADGAHLGLALFRLFDAVLRPLGRSAFFVATLKRRASTFGQ